MCTTTYMEIERGEAVTTETSQGLLHLSQVSFHLKLTASLNNTFFVFDHKLEGQHGETQHFNLKLYIQKHPKTQSEIIYKS